MSNNTNRFNDLASGAAKQILLKTSLRCLVNFVAITDRKANILLSINTIIMSIVISFSGSQLFLNSDKPDQHLYVAVPIIVLLLACLISSLLAILAANPKKIQKQNDEHLGIFLLAKKYKDIDTYLYQMATILKSNDLIYKNIATDIHSVNSFLVIKNALLQKAYYVFFVGILLAVISFISIWLINI